jgi:transglutaminase-like putative cysteine protease
MFLKDLEIHRITDKLIHFNKTDNKLLKISVILIFIVSCDSKVPVILSINPRIGKMGEIITIDGARFGGLQEDSFITIAGIIPTESSYYLWQDNLIMVRVPELGESGLIYVHTKGKRSNGILFSNSAIIPQPVDGEKLGLGPKINSVSPQTGAPGTLITITGSNFGRSREGGGVFFTWDFESQLFNNYVVREPEFIEVSELELGYISWNTREISVRIPDGAVKGNFEVRTPSGRSLPVFFDVNSKSGKKRFYDKRSYTVNYTVDIKVLDATRPNILYLWVPRPVFSPSQRNVNNISSSDEPFVENHRGVNLYKLENLGTGTNHSINLTFRVDVYAVETEVNPLLVKQEPIPLSAVYTQSTTLLPEGNTEIKTAVNTIIGREQNPYIKAKLIYDWIISNIKIRENFFTENIISALIQKQSDPCTTALLYTAMVRAAGIPCIPVAGILIDNNRQTLRHYWTEFWINDFGWVPVDPVMGAESIPQSFSIREDSMDYYFGNIDNQHIAFSRGELILSQMENNGRIVSKINSYSFQNIWEEASGGLEAYTSLWGDIIISGIYVQ